MISMNPFQKATLSILLPFLSLAQARHTHPSSKTAFQFQFPPLPSFFQPSSSSSSSSSSSLRQQKQQLLNLISNTNNGKTATSEQQKQVLTLVRTMELQNIPPTNLFSDTKSLQDLDGTWYLQYTSPSQLQNDMDMDMDMDIDIEDGEEDAEEWTPINGSEGNSKIPTNQASSKGSISAAGITVDTSNKPVLQIIDISQNQIRNEVQLDFGKVMVGGSFRPSDSVSNRVVVAFEYGMIQLDKLGGLKIPLDNVFQLVGFVRGTMDSGWLETTFLNEDVRIGRGNMGTMFILTRNQEDVIP